MPNLRYYDKTKLKKELKDTKFSLSHYLKCIFSTIIIKTFNYLSKKFNEIYYYSYNHKTKIFNVSFRLLLIVGLILTITGLVLFYLNYNTHFLIWFILITVCVLYLIIFIFLKLYHKYFGRLIIYEYELSLTKEYVVNKLPHIIKIYGKTGVGKDSLSIGLASILRDSMMNNIILELANLKRILYIFNFNIIENFIMNNYRLFSSFSYKININRLFNILYKYYGFIKEKYRLEISYQRLVEYYFYQQKYPNAFITKYSFYDGIKYYSFYDLLLTYILKYIRVYIEQNFIISNQPVIEDTGNNLTAKKFSMNYLQIKDYEIKKGNKKYITKCLFPWKDNIIVLETECGSWYFNRDKENSKVLYETGVRDFKAYNRHFIDNLYWFMVDQDAVRVDKLLRELDHSYVQVLNKEIIAGGIKRQAFYGFLLKFIEHKINKFESKQVKFLDKFKKYKKRLKIYTYLNNENKIKYYDRKIKKYNLNIKKRDYSSYYNKAKKYSELIARAKNDGFIQILINLSDSPTPVNLKQTTIQSLLKQDKVIYHESYQITLTFKIKDIHGKYDTHYMKAVSEEVAGKSELDFVDIPRWDSSLKLTKEDALEMGYPASFNMFNIKTDDYIANRFKEKNKEKNEANS